MFLLVFALPKDSNIGLESRSLSLTFSISPFLSVTSEMYCNIFLEASVFPEPDSPIFVSKKIVFFYLQVNLMSMKILKLKRNNGHGTESSRPCSQRVFFFGVKEQNLVYRFLEDLTFDSNLNTKQQNS